MTAWQDQPPQSRRQLRLNERGDVHDDGAQGARSQDSHVDVAESIEPSTMDQSTLGQSMLGQSPIGQPVVEPPRDAFARPGWEASARADADADADADAVPEAPASSTHQPRSRAEAALASGRRSQHSFPHAVPADPREGEHQESRRSPAQGSASAETETETAAPSSAEPLNYFTQGRSQVPVYGGPSFGVNAVTPPPADPAEVEPPEGASGGYRIRDFSPESRRSAFSSTAEPPASSLNPSTASAGGHLDYYTQQGGGKQAAANQSPADHSQAEPAAAEPALAEPVVAEPAAAEPLQAEQLAWQAPADRATADQAPSAPAELELDIHELDAPASDAPAAGREAGTSQTEHTMTRRELRAMRESSAAAIAEPTPVSAEPTPATAAEQQSTETPVPPAAQSWSAQSWSIDSAELPVAEQAVPAQEAPVSIQDPPTQDPPTQGAVPLQAPVPLRSPDAPAPQSSRELSDAMAEFDALMARKSGPVTLPEAPVESTRPNASPFGTGLVPAETEIGEAQLGENENENETDRIAPGELEQDNHGGVEFFDSLLGGEQAVEAQPVWPPATELSSSEPKAAGQASTAEQPGTAEQPSVAEQANTAEPTRPADQLDGSAVPVDAVDHHYIAPMGHWSRQAASDDGQADGISLSRNVGATSGAVTANHLVVSSVPTVNDLLKPFSATGEIMITGTIDLPRSLGTTGAHPARYDHSDVDTLLEASDREDTNVDSAPVRAIRAVSTHTSSRGLIGTGKPPHSSRLPMILAVSTAAVAAVVVVLFVAGLVLHVF